MFRDNELNLGFSEQDTQKVLGVLSRLIPHVVQENLVIVGGITRRHHLMRHGIPYPQRPFNDLDFMIRDRSEMKPSITSEFLLAHYHLPRDTSFFAGLVDPQTKVTIDVFDYYHAPIDLEEVEIGGFQLKIRGSEDQLTKTVYDLMKITKGYPLNPKEFDSADQLLEIVDLEKTERIWRMKYTFLYPFSIMEAIQRAKDERRRYPERVFEFPSRTTEPFNCLECTEVPGFTLTPKKEIIKLLGYVDKT
ncbi:hypothetical protein A3B42_02405 [Candidatus Daviesbacteria bacterium RIFCSPLOWO2_01_FULL_38_10]|nr:MAG: hypothetical protein A3D02_03270 [Candidatus Daviesbacteria bacterium RIFCSPHIGHO2_02_FULL_39_41]OGE39591.1 MAG: hypothetical protein A3B42_02405 [Candidatus Daviesbacteria bacterium RIFCSPLOWO2_01_FULL_38_10]OGE45452.1 MAG: hypothetical protein A3E67_00135 [Candidatus Daviesbacteria bacterium RIFCSPHIGHO2_12_FULL_38_25]OGE68764.1 MAG: hypothetical protein A3H81_06150 [Candidatus Daviesbacteria bacterium RIFCSPLOWO2_02_FULL_38_18]OGE73503.1 MAG: hypothetical protein A3H18_05790 [Candida